MEDFNESDDGYLDLYYPFSTLKVFKRIESLQVVWHLTRLLIELGIFVKMSSTNLPYIYFDYIQCLLTAEFTFLIYRLRFFYFLGHQIDNCED